ncbi:hypothetical protein LTR64_007259 [Lithohypha guttulata]|uniref:uncharacterized protein n=1 Tax=Lithohypha guttulata TaxID=1690604 RepID=UPI002DDF529C|nr:hypothetical protein LTR51_004184 [Lithohypha guttulata]
MPSIKATKVLQKRSDAALESFHAYYVKIWGEGRWHNSLFPALSQSTRYCALINQFGNASETMSFLQEGADDQLKEEDCLQCLRQNMGESAGKLSVVTRSSDKTFPRARLVEGLHPEETVLSHWALDFASVLAASILNVEPRDRVLDMCAAPGGKSIVLAQLLFPTLKSDEENDQKSILHSNEYDSMRCKRLTSNLQAYLPKILFANKAVKALQLDGSTKTVVNELPLGEGGYDKVLLDAPCSSERHIVHAYLAARSSGRIADEMANWKPSHSKKLAKTQGALLMTTLKAVKIGGSVLYATCSISIEENDGVIEATLDALGREQDKNHNREWQIQVDRQLEDRLEAKATLDKFSETTKHETEIVIG